MSAITVAEHLTGEDRREALVDDALLGLSGTPRRLSPIWFYDERGSALFDEITRLPEYYPTRTERALLESAAAEIVGTARADTLVELGSGTSEKTRVLLDAMGSDEPLRYVPLDVDPDTLRAAADALTLEYPALEIHAVAGDFLRHLEHLPDGGRRLVAFLGSTIGNLTPSERRAFLLEVATTSTPDDHLLLGVDLVKDPDRLRAAYDDAAGVTAAFNRNALRVVNRELGADFDPDAFDHVARWVPEERWMELALRARTPQTVCVADLDLVVELEAGEEVQTEISAKFTPQGIASELHDAGFVVARSWQAGVDDFLLVLARPAH